VSVNGVVVRELGTKADPASDDVRVDGRRVRPVSRLRYILLHKPTGYVTTRSDPQGRPTILDLLSGVGEYVYPVGRLDYDSAGLLVVTNDGDLAARLAHPRHGVEKAYHAVVRGVPAPEVVASLERGIVIDGVRTSPARVRVLKAFTRRGRIESVLEMVIREGRNRQVRRMCEAVGHPVERLTRVRVGPIADARLAAGAWRELSPGEVEALKAACAAQPALFAPGARVRGKYASTVGRSPGRAK